MKTTDKPDKVALVQKVAVGFKILENYYDEAVVTNFVKALEGVDDEQAIDYIDRWLKTDAERMPRPGQMRQELNRRAVGLAPVPEIARPSREERDAIIAQGAPKLRMILGMRPKVAK